MIIDHVQDLDLGAAGEPPVGDISLPALVRHLGTEPDEGAPGSLLGLRGDEPPARQDPPDRRDRRDHILAVTPAQVDRDRVGSGIHAEIGELLAELHDLILDRLRGAARAPMRTA